MDLSHLFATRKSTVLYRHPQVRACVPLEMPYNTQYRPQVQQCAVPVLRSMALHNTILYPYGY